MKLSEINQPEKRLSTNLLVHRSLFRPVLGFLQSDRTFGGAAQPESLDNPFLHIPFRHDLFVARKPSAGRNRDRNRYSPC